jgi:predicted NUDIX family phosphoesterase
MPPARRDPLTPGGDKARLRGLPVLTRGVGGHIPGTDPLGELLRREAQRERRA